MTNVPTIAEVAQGVAILGALGAGLYFANARTLKYYENKPHLQFRRQHHAAHDAKLPTGGLRTRGRALRSHF